jgi:hypothetical protein
MGVVGGKSEMGWSWILTFRHSFVIHESGVLYCKLLSSACNGHIGHCIQPEVESSASGPTLRGDDL